MSSRIRFFIKKIIVTALVYAPTLADTRTAILSVYRRVFRRPLEPAYLALDLLGLSGAKVLLDIGGGWGQSIAALRNYTALARIISFEPNPFFVARMQTRFARDSLVEIRPVAIGGFDGVIPLFIPVYRYSVFPDIAALSKTDAENWLPMRIFGFEPGLQTSFELNCHLQRIDTLNLDPEIIKIDTRCDASAIIEGASKTIETSRPLIMLEAATLSAQCAEQLNKVGFVQLTVSKGSLLRTKVGEPCDIAVHLTTLERLAPHIAAI